MTTEDFAPIWNALRAHWPNRGPDDLENRKVSAYFKRLKKFSTKQVDTAAQEWIDTGRGFPNVSDLLKLMRYDHAVRPQKQKYEQLSQMTLEDLRAYDARLEEHFNRFKEQAHSTKNALFATCMKMAKLASESARKEMHIREEQQAAVAAQAEIDDELPF